MAKGGWDPKFLEKAYTLEARWGHGVPQMTDVAISEALRDFPVPLAAGRDMEQLAAVIRGYMGVRWGPAAEPVRIQGNAETRDNLRKLSAGAEKLIGRLSALWDSSDNNSPEGEAIKYFKYTRNKSGTSTYADDDADYVYAMRSLRWVEQFISDASDFIEVKDNPPQLESWRRERRINSGAVLMHIYAHAFGQRVTLNEWRASSAQSPASNPTPFMEFYLRIMKLVGDSGTDVSGVLREARKRVRAGRYPGISV